MRRNISNSLLAVLLLSVLISCKAKREILKAEAPAVKSGKAEELTAINNSAAKYATLSIKAKTDLSINDNAHDVTMNIRINHDKAIWVSVTAIAGLQIARALITPDSVKVLNYMENTYMSKPFSYIHGFTNKQVNFGTIEAIFAGNAMQEVVTEQSELTFQGNQTTLSGMLESLSYNLRFNERNKVVQTTLNDESAAQTLLINYTDFMQVQNQIVPHGVNIKSQALRNNVVIDLKYSRVGLNETLEMPYNVPKRFTLKN